MNDNCVINVMTPETASDDRNDNCVINVMTPETASDDRNCGVSPPGTAFHKRNCEHSVSQKNCELQRDTKKTATSNAASHKKFRFNLRLTKGIYLNWRLTKEIAVRSVSQKAFI